MIQEEKQCTTTTAREETYFDLVGSLIPPSLCYLRPIPIQPVLDAFEKHIQNANIDEFYDLVSVIKKGVSHTGSEDEDEDEDALARMETLQNGDYLLNFSEELEEDAAVARNLSNAFLPRLLKHRLSMPSSSSTRSSTTSKHHFQFAKHVMHHKGRLKFVHEHDCDWRKIHGWNEKSAMKEYSKRLLQNIHSLQNLEYKTNDKSLDPEFDDWLKNRKDRWRSEQIYRKVRCIASSKL